VVYGGMRLEQHFLGVIFLQGVLLP
jgi:hypothetical protein